MTSQMYLLVLGLVSLVTAGYLPPSDPYGNQTPMCGCDDERYSALADKMVDLEANLNMYRSRSNALERKFQSLERKKRQAHGVNSQETIAFTAYLSQYTNDMSINQAVVYDKTLLNEGGAYSTTTGKFTAPFDGIYLFSFIIEAKHQVDIAARLVVEGVNEVDAVVEPEHNEQNLQGGNVVILKIQEGQQVWVSIYNTNHQSLEGADNYRFNTFSGALLAPVFGEQVIG